MEKFLSFVLPLAVLAVLYVPMSLAQEDVSTDPWIIQPQSNPSNMDYMASIGNGHIAMTVQTNTIHINGFFAGRGGSSHRVRIKPEHSIRLSSVGSCTTPTRTPQLDLKTGVYTETVTCNQQGTAIFRTYAHRYYNRVLITEVEVRRDSGFTGDLRVTYENLNGDREEEIQYFEGEPHVYEDAACEEDHVVCWFKHGATWLNATEVRNNAPTAVLMYWNLLDDEFILREGRDRNTWTFVFAAEIPGAANLGDEFDEVITMVANGQRQTLLDMHTESWENLWNSGHIDVEGSDLNLRKLILTSFYYLYSNLPSLDTARPNRLFYGLSSVGLARGESEEDYAGHVLWDTEFWMYPPILMFQNELAKELLNYRIHGMDAAFERAEQSPHTVIQDRSYEGTRFPRESAFTGVEVTRHSTCARCRENEQHITGDIAFAARQYLAATRDTDFLNTPQIESSGHTGFELIQEMARFWSSRALFNEDTDKYDIDLVMGPDEYHDTVNNSIFTNTVASMSIHFSKYAACLADKDPAEIPDDWITVAENLLFTYNNGKKYHEQFEGYDNTVAPGDLPKIMQADAVLLGYPLLRPMTSEVRRNDLEHYEARTDTNGPAMTWGMHAIAWLELGDRSKAAGDFTRSYEPYVQQPYKIWRENGEGSASEGAKNFLTGMGGFLQAVMSGYGGLRLHEEHMEFNAPVLPTGVTQVSMIGLDYLGQQLNIVYNTNQVTVTQTSSTPSAMPLVIEVRNGNPINLINNQPQSFDVGPFRIYTTVSTNCEVPTYFIDGASSAATTRMGFVLFLCFFLIFIQ